MELPWFITAAATTPALPSFLYFFLFFQKVFPCCGFIFIRPPLLFSSCVSTALLSEKKECIVGVWGANRQRREALAYRPAAAAATGGISGSPRPESAFGENNVEQEKAAVHGLQSNPPPDLPPAPLHSSRLYDKRISRVTARSTTSLRPAFSLWRSAE